MGESKDRENKAIDSGRYDALQGFMTPRNTDPEYLKGFREIRDGATTAGEALKKERQSNGTI